MIDMSFFNVGKPDDRKKIRTPFARIVICGSFGGKDYYGIMYADPVDGEIHEGFGSTELRFVKNWLADEFEISDEPFGLVCVAKGQNMHADVGAEAISGVIDAGNREQMASEVSVSKDALIATLYERLSEAEERAARWEEDARAVTESEMYKAHELLTIDWVKQVKRADRAEKALAMMWFAYENKDPDNPHDFELEAAEEACATLGGWENARALAFGKADKLHKEG